MDSSADMPPYIILYEILTRTSQATVGRCRVVCKRWKEEIYQSIFTKLFLQRTKSASGFFIQSMRSNRRSSTFISMDSNSTLSLSFLPRQIKIEASSKQGGLLLCKDENPPKSIIPQYIICKPTTQQWRKIPNPKTRYFTRKTAMLVLGSSPLCFKIVRFSEPKNPCITNKCGTFNVLRCEIFYFKTWSWKCLSEHVMFPHGETLGFKPMVSTSGVLHTFTTEKRIFAFDLVKESWEIFALPCPLRDDNYCERCNMQLVESQGVLGLIRIVREEFMELWVVEDYYGQRTWTRRNRISIERLIREEKYVYPEALCNNDVALMKSTNKIMFYNFRTFTSDHVDLRKILSGSDEFFRLESDCEPDEIFDVPSKRFSTTCSDGV